MSALRDLDHSELTSVCGGAKWGTGLPAGVRLKPGTKFLLGGEEFVAKKKWFRPVNDLKSMLDD